ncbi:MAG: hypothetical protein ACI8Z1_001656, partial [Candidatus Azotimanducaceae bacterium]
QAPVTLALSCADHGSINAVATAMPMSEADCHSKMTQMAPQPADASDCCDACACPAALAVALTSDTVELVLVPAPELISAPSMLFVSLHPERILHPPIS